MNKKITILGIVLLVVLAVAAVGGGIAYAQIPIPNTGYGPGWMMSGNQQITGYGAGMMGGYAQNGDSWEWMNSMHQWMTTSGGTHTFVWNALVEKLGLTSDELYTEVNSGKTLAEIAEEQGVSRADLLATLETAHKDALAQAVTDGALTQEQADGILAQMAGRYEWMIDSAGASYGVPGGRGGMMGRYSQQDGSGQFVPGGCHGYGYGGLTDQQPKP